MRRKTSERAALQEVIGVDGDVDRRVGLAHAEQGQQHVRDVGVERSFHQDVPAERALQLREHAWRGGEHVPIPHRVIADARGDVHLQALGGRPHGFLVGAPHKHVCQPHVRRIAQQLALGQLVAQEQRPVV